MVYGNKCLDAYDRGTTNGTRVVIWDCNGREQPAVEPQQPTAPSPTSTPGSASTRTSAATANGTKLVLWTCNGQDNQKWTVS